MVKIISSKKIRNYEDFKKYVPLHDYEDLKPYIERIRLGESNILWKGKPLYFAKTSGTTSGIKYIPITKSSMSNHIEGAQYAIFNYIYKTGKTKFLDKKWIFLQGSPELKKENGIHIGRLSGIVNHHVPQFLKSNQLPSYQTNCIEDWGSKLDKIIEETLKADMSAISGIPPWVQMYFDKIVKQEKKTISEVFPNFSLFIYGGVNFKPYHNKFINTIGKSIDSIELFPASEGFFAYQDELEDEGMLLITGATIFYEFVEMASYFNDNPKRISLEDIEVGKNYGLVISSDSGLWGYKIGDTVKFTSKNPYKLLVTGRTKHFISAFGEHVIAEEIEQAIAYALEKHPETEIVEFTVAPQVNPKDGKPHHQWLISFSKRPQNLGRFALDIDTKLCCLNTYYNDLIQGRILRPLRVSALPVQAFQFYMNSIGKLGGQNKVPRLANNRQFADGVLAMFQDR